MKDSEKQIGKMDEKEIDLMSISLIYKLSAITGWSIPEKRMLGILLEQMSMKLKESYPYLNSKEIEYAFRNTTVKDYGKNFNLITFGEVIDEYKEKRKEAVKLIKQPLQIEMPTISDKEKIDELNEYMARTDINTRNLHLLPIYLYNYLRDLKLLRTEDSELNKIYNDAVKLKMSLMLQKAENDYEYKKDYLRFKEQYEKGYFDETQSQQIHIIYLKLNILDYFVRTR